MVLRVDPGPRWSPFDAVLLHACQVVGDSCVDPMIAFNVGG